MAPNPIWKPRTEHGKLDRGTRKELPDEAFAFPKQRKETIAASDV